MEFSRSEHGIFTSNVSSMAQKSFLFQQEDHDSPEMLT